MIGLFHVFETNFQIYLNSILKLITLGILTQYDKTGVLQRPYRINTTSQRFSTLHNSLTPSRPFWDITLLGYTDGCRNRIDIGGDGILNP